ncbi:MAG TPA: Ig-like domain-containing protein, partial [Acidimicrobiia bacterium]|nr:Ig-like domain-containing protein [Acidimicrobiia bacterium]
MPRTRYQVIFAAVAVLAAAGAVGFVISSEAATERGAAQEAEQTGNMENGELAAPGEADSAAPAPAASVEIDQAGNAPADRPLVIRLANGSLTGVTVEDPQGQGLPGDLTADGLAWQSSEPPVPHTAYTVRVSALASDQQPFDQTLNVTSGPPGAVLRATHSPNDNEVVGIGMPAVVALNRAVTPADRPIVEQRLSVTTNPPVEGDWRWITPSRVHWRPATYWQPGTEVSVASDLQGLKVTDAWGEGQKTIHFKIGPARVSTVDVATYQMTST